MVLADRTTLIYIGANNDLQNDASKSINEIIEGAKNIKNGILLVYLKNKFNSCLFKIHSKSSTDKPVIDTLKKYSSGNSSDPYFLHQVVLDARSFAPAKTYGLVLWSHATSWAPPANIKTKAFGYDDEMEMDIKDMKNALPSDLEYIIFDACSMGSIEVCYELKDKAKYILASPTEVLSSGFPYDKLVPFLFEGEEGLIKVSKEYMKFYKSQNGDYASATVSLVKTSTLDSVAFYSQKLFSKKKPGDVFNMAEVQSLRFDKATPAPAYDFLNMVKHNFNKTEYAALEEKINEAVIYKDCTAKFLGQPIKDYCGLSIYYPVNKNSILDNYYKTLDWYYKGGGNYIIY